MFETRDACERAKGAWERENKTREIALVKALDGLDPWTGLINGQRASFKDVAERLIAAAKVERIEYYDPLPTSDEPYENLLGGREDESLAAIIYGHAKNGDRDAVEEGLTRLDEWSMEGQKEAWREISWHLAAPEPVAGTGPDQSPAAAGTADNETAKGKKGKHVDERMLVAFRDDPQAVYLSLNQWAEKLGCAKSTVAETETWQKICKPARERERLARGHRLRKSKAPKKQDNSDRT